MNEKEYIRDLQKKLREISYHDGDIPPVAINGVYDDETKNAVRAFQKKQGTEVTGIVDRETHDRLQKEYAETLDRHGYPEKIGVFPLNPENFVLKSGDRTFATEILQYMMKELSTEWQIFEQVEISGVFDETTENAVKSFQKSCGFEVTGKVDRRTWNKLANLYNQRQKKCSE